MSEMQPRDPAGRGKEPRCAPAAVHPAARQWGVL